ncbi:phosphatidate cytidylyltransferase [Truncatella angustata]|uniref:dolichol kinase n=1 Tax=Truncatella angustata TaxID=152316 RepID=A0A9P8UFK7_9PEZI|nr:phosphatidate cytidylyltransferase [Truncatella angustata]KAH6648970.1 phosphatidate cytidylyltransferase [Truncatella angustata]
MPEHLSSSTAPRPNAIAQLQDENEALRLLSRSPHPYHRQKSELLEPSDRFSSSTTAPPGYRSSVNGNQPRSRTSFPAVSRETTPTASDSGTEADDEHFLKGLPAPRTKLHKGLRGHNELLSGTSSPLPSPALPEDEYRRNFSKRNRVIVRRLTELILLGSLGTLVYSNDQARPVLYAWRKELFVSLGIASLLAALYPLRVVCWAYRHRNPSRRIPLTVTTNFDPAPLLYPIAITLLVSSLISIDNDKVLLPNIILSLCVIPPVLIPKLLSADLCSPLHWLISCAPIVVSQTRGHEPASSPDTSHQHASVQLESLVLLYPLHQYLCITLQSLTTTSLLTAELQLLSVALINVLLLSSSPQITIIKAMLWVGGLDILVSCTRIILWGIALARVPKWRFRRTENSAKRHTSFLSALMSWKRVRHDLFRAPMDGSSCSSCENVDDAEDSDGAGGHASKGLSRVKTATLGGADSTGLDGPFSGSEHKKSAVRFEPTEAKQTVHRRRHTLPFIDKVLKKSYTHTPSGRRKRSSSSSVRAFFALTQEQATTRKWLYALYVYVCIAATVFFPSPIVGVKDFVQEHALKGYEPIGWALGYLFGDLNCFRWQVVSHLLERWICLPPRVALGDDQGLGWVQYLRHAVFGEANTRLLLSGYYVIVLIIGLLIVFKLSPKYEVDTRRKVFHFMMVAMLAPSIYIDPAFVALALSIVLSLFLILDLLRASQLPPLSKPLASFLAPYVDGRDLRGPVVISHIFLLIGCAIPLWLSLGSLPRTGTGYMEGWEVPTREVSMVAGVICVGLGDAAASLIGRRYGHRKWLWGGGKSLEGSVAFAAAVFLGLMAAHIWLKVGGWPTATPLDSLPVTISKTTICASTASLTEAVLTGGNDNVVVPVVLWTCVKGFGI